MCAEKFSIGTKEYWNDVYKVELQNYNDYGDEGDIWFGKSNMERVNKWLASKNICKTNSVLDVGCGNGVMLIHLSKAGFHNLTGIDFIEEAVELASKIAIENSCKIKFETIDFLSDISNLPLSSSLQSKFEVIIDKGTFDAISMCSENSQMKREKYRQRLMDLLTKDGYFIIISCNWTRKELIENFTGFQVIDEIPTPAMSFGGKIGHTVTSLVMQLK